MKQTETYKLSLIETSDTFSPDALNDNAEALEKELARIDAALGTKAPQTEIARIDAALVKFASGTYVGDGTKGRRIDLPFTPKVAFVTNAMGQTYTGNNLYHGGLAVEGHPIMSSTSIIVEVVEGGVQVSQSSSYYSSNTTGTTYHYFALG